MAFVILGVGLCTPVGLSAAAAQRALVSGIDAFGETDVLDEEGEPVRASRASKLPTQSDRTERISFLAERAVQDCLANVAVGHAPPMQAFVALGENDPIPVHSGRVLAAIQKRTAHLSIDFRQSPVLAGPAGFFHALHAACAALASGASPVALVGAADSHCDAESLHALAKARRILNRSNRDGSIPSEGAGFVLLARGPTMGLSPIGKIVATAIAQNDGSLGDLFRQLHAASPGRPRPDHLFACQRADRAAGRTLLESYFRAPGLMPEPFRMTLSAESQGDAGVAAGAVELGVLLHRFTIQKRLPSPLRTALLCATGNGARSAGAIVSAV